MQLSFLIIAAKEIEIFDMVGFAMASCHSVQYLVMSGLWLPLNVGVNQYYVELCLARMHHTVTANVEIEQIPPNYVILANVRTIFTVTD